MSEDEGFVGLVDRLYGAAEAVIERVDQTQEKFAPLRNAVTTLINEIKALRQPDTDDGTN